jgi:G3E family GTPase
MSKIPVTVLTGFLGSGKTTLLNRILTEKHGKRIAVIENEFGEIGIDQALVINADEEVFEMNNGCICCTVRGDLIRILGGLMKRRDKFDHVLVETTGMADPSPVAQTFFVDDEIGANFALDGIVTMVDAKHVSLHIDDSNECKEQIAFADVLVLNKTDLVGASDLDALEARIRSMNAMARIERAVHAAVPIADVLDVGGFDLDRALETKPTFLEPEVPFEWVGTFDLSEGMYSLVAGNGPDETMDVLFVSLVANENAGERNPSDRAVRAWSAPKTPRSADATIAADGPVVTLDMRPRGAKRFPLRVPRNGRYALYTQHLPSEFSVRLEGPRGAIEPASAREFAAGHSHDDRVTSVGIHLEGPVDGDKLNKWLSVLLREKGADIFRMKGILDIRGNDKRFVFQGVHMLFDGREDKPWGTAKRASDLVFIGKNLDRVELTEGFRRCLT